LTLDTAGDGFAGWSEHGPYDAIYVGAAADGEARMIYTADHLIIIISQKFHGPW